ncbi:hypothetical protein J7F03_35430 [Streptomyces sp. ISL-43]|uniref:hypothetical protein n=1 Tax=Streptomyces sp. ISL-43 TaxID=2819183 RepID=UPI001BEC0560|nr:hypothetical protein [Streptomyces sp. ISL-43]MBT2452261.1 hypothetical protein [Streptomyces sp. ISL-43]
MDEIAGWVWGANVRPFLELLSGYVGYDFDGTDWDTVELAVDETDDERADGWYSYPLVGSGQAVEVRLARAVGGEEVMVSVAGVANSELRVRTETLLSAFASS